MLTKQAADAIEDVNSKYGLNLPVVVIGYRCVGRCAHWMLRACTLIRSDKLVINHIIAGFQNGRTCVDLKQMVMRGGGGRTRAEIGGKVGRYRKQYRTQYRQDNGSKMRETQAVMVGGRVDRTHLYF